MNNIRQNTVYASLLIYSIAILGSMASMNIGAGLVIAAVVFTSRGLSGFISEVRVLFRDRLSKHLILGSLALVLVCFASLLWAKFDPLELGPKGEVHFPRDFAKAWYFVLPPFLYIAWSRLNELQRSNVLRVWVITFGLVSVMGAFQVLTGWPTHQPNPLLPGYFHSSLFMGHHLSVASAWIFPFFVTLHAALSPGFRKTLRLNKSLLYGFAFFGLVVLFFTYSRMLWVALPVGLTVYVFQRLQKRTAIAAIIGLGIFGLILSQTEPVQRRLNHPLGVAPRVELWKANLEFFKERPILGVGWRKNEPLSGPYLHRKYPEKKRVFAGHAHSNYLEVLAGLGLVGIIVWSFWNLTILAGLFRLIRDSNSAAFVPMAFFAAWITFHINGITQVNFWDSKVMHQMMWSVGLLLFWSIQSTRSQRVR